MPNGEKSLRESWYKLQDKYPSLKSVVNPVDARGKLTPEAKRAWRNRTQAAPAAPAPIPTTMPAPMPMAQTAPIPTAPTPVSPDQGPSLLGRVGELAGKAFAPLEAFHKRVVIPAVSSRAKFIPVKWEEGGPKFTFDAYRKAGGGIDPMAVLDAMYGHVGLIRDPIKEAKDMPVGVQGTVRAQRIEEEAQRRETATGMPVSARERRQIGEELYKLPPYVRGALEELPYFTVPPYRVIRGGLQARRAALMASRKFGRATPAVTGTMGAARGALKPLQMVEEAIPSVLRGAAHPASTAMRWASRKLRPPGAAAEMATSTERSAREEINDRMSRIFENDGIGRGKDSEAQRKAQERVFQKVEKDMGRLLEVDTEPPEKALTYINSKLGIIPEWQLTGTGPAGLNRRLIANNNLKSLIERARTESKDLLPQKTVDVNTPDTLLAAHHTQDSIRKSGEWLADPFIKDVPIVGGFVSGVMRGAVQRVGGVAATAYMRGNAALKEAYGYRLLQQLQDSKRSSSLFEFQNASKVFDVDANGMILVSKKGLPKLQKRVAFGDVAENFESYNLASDQIKWIDGAGKYIDQAARNYQLVSGKKLIVKRGARDRYWPRFVVKDGKVTQVDGKIFKNMSSAQQRVSETMQENINKGITYETKPLDQLTMYVESIDKMTRDAIFEKRLLSKGLAQRKGKVPAGFKAGTPPEFFARRGWADLVFDEETLRQLRGPMSPAIRKGQRGGGTMTALGYAASIPKLLVAGLFDTGQFMIQGLTLLARSPKEWGRAVHVSIRTILDRQYFNQFMQGAYKNKTREAARYGVDVRGISEYLEALPVIGRIPVAGKVAQRFAEGFQAYLGVGRVAMFDSMATVAKRQAAKQRYTPKQLDEELLRIGRIADTLLGGTSTKGLGVSATQRQVESAFLFFAPRYTRSVFATLAHARGNNIGAAETRKVLLNMLWGGATIVAGLVGLSGKVQGKSDEQIGRDIVDALNPTSGRKFMSIKMGSHYYGIGGAYRSVLRLIGDITSEERWEAVISGPPEDKILRNPVAKFVRGRLPMTTGTLADLFDKQNFIGEEFTLGAFTEDPKRFADELISRTFPFPVQALIEALASGEKHDKLWRTPKTYAQATTALGAEFLGARTVPATPSEQRAEFGGELARGMVRGTYDEVARERGYKLPTSGPLAIDPAVLRDSPEEHWQYDRATRNLIEKNPEYKELQRKSREATRRWNPARAEYEENQEKSKEKVFGSEEYQFEDGILYQLALASVARDSEHPMALYKAQVKAILHDYYRDKEKAREEAEKRGILGVGKDPDGPFKQAEDIYYRLLFADDEELVRKIFPDREFTPLEDPLTGEFNWDERNERENFIINTYGENFVRDMKDASLAKLPKVEVERRKHMEYIASTGYWDVEKTLAKHYGVEEAHKQYVELQRTNVPKSKEFLKHPTLGRLRLAVRRKRKTRLQMRKNNRQLDNMLLYYGYATTPALRQR